VTTIIRTKCALRMAAMAVVAGIAVRPATGQEAAETLSVDVGECVKLTTPEERLACFESQVEDARSAPASATTAPAGSGSSGAGFEGRTEEQPPDLHAAVAELRETVPNSYLITLDNGQVWRQTVPKQYALRQGSPVRIYYSRWRAYRLTNEQLKSFIQVERVR
jgi:hypothetical protein